MDKKEMAKLFYALGFLAFVIPIMVHRYVTAIPTPLHILLMIIGTALLFIGLKLSGKEINWNFDFSPSQRKRKR